MPCMLPTEPQTTTCEAWIGLGLWLGRLGFSVMDISTVPRYVSRQCICRPPVRLSRIMESSAGHQVAIGPMCIAGCKMRRGGIRGGHVDAELRRGSRRQKQETRREEGAFDADDRRNPAAGQTRRGQAVIREEGAVSGRALLSTTPLPCCSQLKSIFSRGLIVFSNFRSCHRGVPNPVLMMQRLAARLAMDARGNGLEAPNGRFSCKCRRMASSWQRFAITFTGRRRECAAISLGSWQALQGIFYGSGSCP